MSMISVRLPDELSALLERVAVREERSKAFLVKKALQSYLEDLHDYNLAEDGYKNYVESGSKGIDMEDAMKEFNLPLKHYKKKK